MPPPAVGERAGAYSSRTSIGTDLDFFHFLLLLALWLESRSVSDVDDTVVIQEQRAIARRQVHITNATRGGEASPSLSPNEPCAPIQYTQEHASMHATLYSLPFILPLIW